MDSPEPEIVTGNRKFLSDLILDALTIDGGHHKQWFLEEIAKQLGINMAEHAKFREVEAWEKGVSPSHDE